MDKWFIGFDNCNAAEDGKVLTRDFSPSRWSSEPRGPYKVKRILYTYGGGMGGSSKAIYVTHFPKNFDSLKFITVTDYQTGKEIMLNTSYIVSVENFEVMVRDIHRSTQYWTNDKHHDHEAHYLIQPNAKINWGPNSFFVD